jgi:diguanylate cyclase (GGDEF)-like protein/PAS domain S-box-containing protein
MTVVDSTERFLRSRSALGLLLHLAVCAALSAIVGLSFFYSSLSWFKEHKSQEKVVALQLVDAFVTNYSALRQKLGTDAPVPSTFRAHSIEMFDKNAADGGFSLHWVGRVGREIRTVPPDAATAQTIEGFAATSTPKPQSEILSVGGSLAFRTIYPSLAREQSCVDCHNKLQAGKTTWHLNDVMGAFVIDVPISPFLHSILIDSVLLALGLFFGLTAVGLAIAVLHFRHMVQREEASAEIARAKTFLHTIIENMPLIVTVKEMPGQHYVLLNRAAENLLGVPRDKAIGKRPQDILAQATADVFLAGDSEALRSSELTCIAEQTLDTAHDGERILETKKLRILDEAGEPKYLLALSEDVTERKRAEEKIVYIAHHDAMTDLPNRIAFSEYLDETLARVRSSGEQFALLCLDLDRFKEVNDLFGHAGGDALLKRFAQRLRMVTKDGFLARLGGDEFAIVLVSRNLPGDAEALSGRLNAMSVEEIDVEGQGLHVSLSIGVAIYPADGADTATLLANADAALYRAKAEGRGTTRFFEMDMDKRLRERRTLQHELHQAVARGELVLYYQPQAAIGGEIIGFEALVRWQHSTRGMISPGTFIPLAEESGLINTIGEWILREACREAATWPAPLQIAVNLSPIQFRQGDLAALVHSVLIETGLSPNRLELEITEGVLLDDFARALAILRRLKTLGVRIAMDDFGTGYSSLSYLQAFPFDKIKIDRSFISDLENNTQSAAIVTAVIGLARGLDLPVLAEGVETQYQLSFLSRESCDEVQGYYVGRPRPIAEYTSLLRGTQAATGEAVSA